MADGACNFLLLKRACPLKTRVNLSSLFGPFSVGLLRAVQHQEGGGDICGKIRVYHIANRRPDLQEVTLHTATVIRCVPKV